jgi:hypothetical protein
VTDIAALVALSDDEFIDYVEEHLDPSGPSGDWTMLLSDDLLDRTAQALADLRRDLDRTCAEIGAEATRNEFVSWKRDVYRPTLDHLKVRRDSVVDRKRRNHLAFSERQVREARGLVARLATGIQEHRLAALASGFAPEPHDRALWALLSQLSMEFQKTSLTLDEAIGRGFWRFDGPPADGGVVA